MPLLFSYGTLQDPYIQVEVFGRELAGGPDALPGYRPGRISIADPETLASGGETHYLNAVPTGTAEDSLTGTVFEVTEAELIAADEYEEDAEYRRVLLPLRSGSEAWVYIAPAIAD